MSYDEDLRHALAVLTDQQRVIIDAVYRGHMPFGVLAEQLAIPRQRVSAALADGLLRVGVAIEHAAANPAV